MKIVINKCYGGFGLSKEAMKLYAEKKGLEFRSHEEEQFSFSTVITESGNEIHSFDIERNDPTLVEVVEELGEAADGMCADLRIIDIPDDVDWEVEEYDGKEWVTEKRRTWS